MKIELKSIKYFAAGSQETNCFVATVYIDGKKAGEVQNDGNGGCNFYHPHTVQATLTAYGATLPEVTADMGNGDTFTYKQDADSLVDALLTAHLIERDVKKAMSKRIVFTKKDVKGIYQSKAYPAADLKRFLSQPGTAAALKAETILNLLPLDEAVAVWTAKG